MRSRRFFLSLFLAALFVGVALGGSTALAANGTVTGTLTGPSGEAVDGWVIAYRFDAGGTGKWVSVSSANKGLSSAKYSLSLPPGTYRLFAAEQSGRFAYSFYPSAAAVTDAEDVSVVSAGTSTADIQLATLSGVIKGSVVDSNTGEPVAGGSIDVRLSGGPFGGQVGHVAFPETGAFEVSGLRPGTYQIYYSYNADYTSVSSGDVVLSDAGDVSVTLRPEKLVVATGVVRDAMTGLPVRNQVGTLSNRARTGNSYGRSTGYPTDSNGRYRIGLPASFWWYSIYSWGLLSQVYPHSIDLGVPADVAAGTVWDQDLALVPSTGSLRGTVTGNGAPLPGIRATLYWEAANGTPITGTAAPAGWMIKGTTTTAANGTFAFPGLPASTQYKVGFSDPAEAWGAEFYKNRADLASATAIYVTPNATATTDATLAPFVATYPRQFPVTDPADAQPEGLAIGPNGHVYLACNGPQVAEYTKNGTFVRTIGSSSDSLPGFGGLDQVIDVAVSGGLVYAVDGVNGVGVYDGAGNLVRAITRAGADAITDPKGIAVDSAGNVFLSHRTTTNSSWRISKFSSEGAYLGSFGGSADGAVWTATGIAVSPAGRVYVADWQAGVVRCYEPTLPPVATADLPSLATITYGYAGEVSVFNSPEPSDVACDARGDLWVVDGPAAKVTHMTPAGEVLEQQTKHGGTNADEYWAPKGVALDPNGHVFVADGRAWRNGDPSDLDPGRVHEFIPDTLIGVRGTVTGGGKALAGIRATLYWKSAWTTAGPNAWSAKASVVTGANGAYSFSGLPSALPYAVGFSDDEGVWATEFYRDAASLATATPLPASPNGVVTADAVLGLAPITYPRRFNVRLPEDIDPFDIDVATNGHVFIAGNGPYVGEFTKTGALVRTIGRASDTTADFAGLAHAQSVACFQDRLYIADPDRGVAIYGRDGSLLGAITEAGRRTMSDISGVAVDKAGNVYVCHRIADTQVAGGPVSMVPAAITDGFWRISKFTPTGDYVCSVPDTDLLGARMRIAVTPAGEILAADWGMGRLDRFMPVVSPTSPTPPEAATSYATASPLTVGTVVNQPSDVAVDSSGRTYVVDSGSCVLGIFSASGVKLASWGSEGPGPWQFQGPMGVAIGPQGHIFVANRTSRQVSEFDAYRPPPVPTTLSISTSSSSVLRGRTFTLAGLLKPGALSDVVTVDVKKPRTTRWVTFTTKKVSSMVRGGASKWVVATSTRTAGTYYFRVRLLGTADKKASTSGTIKVVIR